MKTRRVLAVLLMGAMLFTLTGCITVSFSPDGGGVKGKGPVVRRAYSVDPFDSVEVYGNFELVYRSEFSDEIVFEMQENLFEYIAVSVEDGSLRIGSEVFFQTGRESPKVFLSAPALKALAIFGAVEMTDADVIEGETLFLGLAGAGNTEVAVAVEHLRVELSGAGSAVLSGAASHAEYILSGVGSIEAEQLESVDVTATLSGVGSASVHCSGTLRGDVSGVGSLRYRGNPAVIGNVSGLGGIQRID